MIGMNIYVFTSSAQSYCDGPYYFVAKDKQDARDMAEEFQEKHNSYYAKGRPAYLIAFGTEIRTYKIKAGYLPLSRSEE